MDRALSMHLYMVQRGVEDMPFPDAIEPAVIQQRSKLYGKGLDYISGSLYHDSVRRYLEELERVQILFYDDLLAERAKVLEQICRFLGVRPELMSQEKITSNVSGRVQGNLWGRVYKIKMAIGRTRPGRMLRRIIPNRLSMRVSDAIQTAATVPHIEDRSAYRKAFGHMFSDDLERLSEMFTAKGMLTQASTVQRWLKSYKADSQL